MTWQEKVIEGFLEKTKGEADLDPLEDLKKSIKRTRSLAVISLFISLISLLINLLS